MWQRQRGCAATCRGAVAVVTAVLHTARRGIANEYKELRPIDNRNKNGNNNNGNNNNSSSHGTPPAHPPATPHNDPVLPMDFNPHIEWYEFPREVFDPLYPYTRDDAMRATEEAYEMSLDEMASRYGVKLNAPPRLFFWLGYVMSVTFGWYFLWSCYRSIGSEPVWTDMRNIVRNQPNVPTIEDDDIYLDWWMKPESRATVSLYDDLWTWKPLVTRDGAKTTWALPHRVPDESEWRHMTSKY